MGSLVKISKQVPTPTYVLYIHLGKTIKIIFSFSYYNFTSCFLLKLFLSIFYLLPLQIGFFAGAPINVGYHFKSTIKIQGKQAVSPQ